MQLNPSGFESMFLLSGGLILLLFFLFWYHLSGIHKQSKRAADYLEDIAESIHLFEASQKAAEQAAVSPDEKRWNG